MKNDSFNFVDVIHSIDRIRLISKLLPAKLRKRIPEQELLQHCIPDEPGTIVGHHKGKKGRELGWISCIEASACNDYFIEILRYCDGMVLSKLEIAQDLIFNTMDEAEEYGRWFEGVVERRNNRFRFSCGTTLYLGKEKGDNSKNYVRCYPRESKLTGMPCFHVEFVLEGAEIIKKALGIDDHREMMTSMEMFNRLENSLLRYNGYREKRGVPFGSLYIPKGLYRRMKEMRNQP